MHPRAVVPAAGLLLVIGGCGAPAKTPQVKPAPVASPSPSVPGGAVASILCRTHRVQIQSNEQTLAVEEAAGHTAVAAALRVRIRDELNAARAIPGCDVQDLALP